MVHAGDMYTNINVSVHDVFITGKTLEQKDGNLKRQPRFTEREVDALILKVHQNSDVSFFKNEVTQSLIQRKNGIVKTSVNATSVVLKPNCG